MSFPGKSPPVGYAASSPEIIFIATNIIETKKIEFIYLGKNIKKLNMYYIHMYIYINKEYIYKENEAMYLR